MDEESMQCFQLSIIEYFSNPCAATYLGLADSCQLFNQWGQVN